MRHASCIDPKWARFLLHVSIPCERTSFWQVLVPYTKSEDTTSDTLLWWKCFRQQYDDQGCEEQSNPTYAPGRNSSLIWTSFNDVQEFWSCPIVISMIRMSASYAQVPLKIASHSTTEVQIKNRSLMITLMKSKQLSTLQLSHTLHDDNSSLLSISQVPTNHVQIMPSSVSVVILSQNFEGSRLPREHSWSCALH